MARSATKGRIVLALAVGSVLPLLAGCPKKETPQVDAAPPPPPPVEDVQTTLVPMDDDTGAPDTGPDAKPKYSGPAVNPNVARLKQCCAALGNQAKALGSSPEAGMFTAAAAQCSTLAAQAGASGTAPEMGVLRGLLAGRNIPAICAGF